MSYILENLRHAKLHFINFKLLKTTLLFVLTHGIFPWILKNNQTNKWFQNRPRNLGRDK